MINGKVNSRRGRGAIRQNTTDAPKTRSKTHNERLVEEANAVNAILDKQVNLPARDFSGDSFNGFPPMPTITRPSNGIAEEELETERARRGLQTINEERQRQEQQQHMVPLVQVQQMIDASIETQTGKLTALFNTVLVDQLAAFRTPEHTLGFPTSSSANRKTQPRPVFNDSNYENHLGRPSGDLRLPSRDSHNLPDLESANRNRPSPGSNQPVGEPFIRSQNTTQNPMSGDEQSSRTHASSVQQSRFPQNTNAFQRNEALLTQPQVHHTMHAQYAQPRYPNAFSGEFHPQGQHPPVLQCHPQGQNPPAQYPPAQFHPHVQYPPAPSGNHFPHRLGPQPYADPSSHPVNPNSEEYSRAQGMARDNHPYPYEHKRGLHHWELKFDGSTSVEHFIVKVDIIRRANNMTWAYVVGQFHCLIKKPADRWYWSWIYSQQRQNVVVTWDLLKNALIRHFGSIQTDEEITRLLNDKRQKPSEKFSDFFEEFMTIHDGLRVPKSDAELITILKRNICNRLFPLTYNILANDVDTFRILVSRVENDLERRYQSYPYNTQKFKDGKRVNEIVQEELSDSNEQEMCVDELRGRNGRENKNRNSHSGKELHCYKCGYPGVTVPTCPRCQDSENPLESGSHVGAHHSQGIHPTLLNQ